VFAVHRSSAKDRERAANGIAALTFGDAGTNQLLWP
jgi:hypothetical protein